MPRIIIIAGPNGSGKTTFGLQYREHEPELEGITFLNADEIARNLPEEFSGVRRDLEGSRQLIVRINELTNMRQNFMVETTLAVRWYANQIPEWKSMGYHIALFYLRLPDADYAVMRVKRRVEFGGHDIPEDVVRRRYTLSLEYLESIYRPIVDELVIVDNEDGGGMAFATGDKDG